MALVIVNKNKNKQLKNVFDKIKNHLISNKIKSININNKIMDFRSIKKYTYNPKDKIILSKKYLNLKLFTFEECKLIYENFINTEHKKNKICIKKGKIFDFNISKHAREQFVKRFILLIKHKDCHFNLSNELLNIGHNNLKRFISMYKNNTINNEENIKFIDNLIINIIKNSELISFKNINHPIDKSKFRQRINKRNVDTFLFFNSPFLFIFTNNNLIVTIELYSQSYYYRDLNFLCNKKNDFNKYIENL